MADRPCKLRTVQRHRQVRYPGSYHAALKCFKGLSHVTVEVNPNRAAA
ncbi:hypothetical protein BN2476_930047 [Paraburkholderia piptadeniae]|uniref:Uncharacterized protein n=1 Tax=Paraburkholderia piptadeniae TaxID=1701573 RepID=A0A1N7SUY9_9BURK|nr:hypothetical protein [Paraburkholderia piptadeniae]SIT50749.1 hypothetical protein BN2476_930047 [Paraburkholderia piptadeniae]